MLPLFSFFGGSGLQRHRFYEASNVTRKQRDRRILHQKMLLHIDGNLQILLQCISLLATSSFMRDIRLLQIIILLKLCRVGDVPKLTQLGTLALDEVFEELLREYAAGSQVVVVGLQCVERLI